MLGNALADVTKKYLLKFLKWLLRKQQCLQASVAKLGQS